MTLRRYTPLKPSKGTVVPPELRVEVFVRDGGCVGPRVGMPGDCAGPLDPDHVRASGAVGRKSRTTRDNLVTLCRFGHHRLKTERARTWRPKLLDYLATVEPALP